MIELLIVATLILLNGLFALSELAIVSARHPRLKVLAASGRPGADRALALAADPGRFLSAVQIGITLIGIVNGAYSGEAFGSQAAAALKSAGLSEAVAQTLGFGSVIAVITYLSVIVGELVPKTLALRNAEGIACAVAPAMQLFSTVAGPAVWLLDSSTRLVFRLLGQSVERDSRVTDEEIRTLIAEAESAGVLEKSEREMISGVLRLGDRAVVGLMTPRPDVEWVDISAEPEAIRKRLIQSGHSRLPVGEGTVDNLQGVVQTREVLADMLAGKALDLRAHLRKALIIPESMDALDLLARLRDAEVPMALIHDEYGHFEGLVTPADILEAIAGVFRSDLDDDDEPYATERADGSWLLSGAMPVDEMAERIGLTLPAARSYETVAGYVLALLQHLPRTGETIEGNGWSFEIVDMDGRRIDKVLATKLKGARRASI